MKLRTLDSTPTERPRPQRLSISYVPNPDKGSAFGDALLAAGHQFVAGPGDVTLTHVEMPVGNHKDILDLNDKVIIYPHSAGAIHFADGRWGPHPNVIANFVVGTGPIEIMRTFGYPHELISVGWPYGGLGPFQPTDGRRVLFAPIHPRGHGYASRRTRLSNRRAYEALLAMRLDRGLDLHVRLVGTHRQNGIYRVEGVPFTSVGYGGTATGGGAGRPLDDDLDDADVVVTAGTVLFRALARGLPTVGYSQMLWPEDWVHPEQRLLSRRWPAYSAATRYPIDLFADDPATVVDRACRTDEHIADWRSRFIGEAFDPASFVRDVERVVASS